MRRGCSRRSSDGPCARSSRRWHSTGRSTTSLRWPSQGARSSRVAARLPWRSRRLCPPVRRYGAWFALTHNGISMTRRILVDARTPVNYTMFAPVHAAMRDDDRVQFAFIASEDPDNAAAIFSDAGPSAELVTPARAAVMRFHAYVTSDFTWTPL